jgi:hypothetical protein
MLRSFDLEFNHENLEEQENNPFDYFFQSEIIHTDDVMNTISSISSTILGPHTLSTDKSVVLFSNGK